MKVFAFAAAMAALGFASPALAASDSPFGQVTPYATVGYAFVHIDDADGFGDSASLGAIQGRVGARFAKFFAIEGELSGGVKNTTVDAGVPVKLKLSDQEGIYGVVLLPTQDNVDIFARVGYTHAKVSASASGLSASQSDGGVAYGGGLQYFFTAKDGVRFDYTHHHYSAFGGADVLSVAYARKF